VDRIYFPKGGSIDFDDCALDEDDTPVTGQSERAVTGDGESWNRQRPTPTSLAWSLFRFLSFARQHDSRLPAPAPAT